MLKIIKRKRKSGGNCYIDYLDSNIYNVFSWFFFFYYSLQDSWRDQEGKRKPAGRGGVKTRWGNIEQPNVQLNSDKMLGLHLWNVTWPSCYLTRQINTRALFHENVLARTVVNAGSLLWMAKWSHITSGSTTLWTSRWSKDKVHWVNLNSVNVNVKGIVKQWHFPPTSNLKIGSGYVLLADHRKWPEFRAVLAKAILWNWVLTL